MRGEAAARRDPVLVDHPQRAEAHPVRVVVMPERKGVPAVEPAHFDATAFGRRARNDHFAAAALADASVVMRIAISSPTFGT